MHLKTPEERKAGLVISFAKEKRIEIILSEIQRGMTRPTANTHSEKRGRNTEERFFNAWSYKGHYPSWLREVLPATITEDLYHATDAIFCFKDGKRVHLQIKSSSFYAGKHIQEHPDIPVVVIEKNDGDKIIRQKTLDAIATKYKI